MAASTHGEAPPQTQADTSVKVITRRRSSMMSTMQEHELDEKLEARARSNTEELRDRLSVNYLGPGEGEAVSRAIRSHRLSSDGMYEGSHGRESD